MPLPLWIRTPDDMQALARELEGVGALAIDTEADSLHHYPGKLCLVQVADARGRGHLVDPLALRDLSPLGPVLADPDTLKVLHAADNDLAYLKRLYGVTVTSLFDTAVAARFLGAPALGLEGLLTQYLGVTAVKSRQKDDWSRRPLSPEQEAYALDDVLHLIPLRERLLEALHAIGRAQWVEEECAGLAALAVPEKPADPDAYMKLKGARDLDARGLGVLRELHAARETLALRPAGRRTPRASWRCRAARRRWCVVRGPPCSRRSPAGSPYPTRTCRHIARARGPTCPGWCGGARRPCASGARRPRRRSASSRACSFPSASSTGSPPRRPPTLPRCDRSRACATGASACSAPIC
jgi:hypothetical protein